ncbi:MAG: hypothetical protein RMJ84_12120 [Sandaracinaceae bacterium]|nr:hypothetical protein [Sandaracinaceae bacterium]
MGGRAPCEEDRFECTTVRCDERSRRCVIDTNDAMCSDGDACNGIERCHPYHGCQPGPAPVCNDESPCTIDSCNPSTGCVYTPRDLDGDGFVSIMCEGGTDCDDDPRTGARVFPGAPEVCDNRRDDNCDGRRDFEDPMCRPSNEGCETASRLSLGPTGGTFSGSTTGLRSNYTLACAPGMGPDAVFRFRLEERRDIRVTTTASGAALALRRFDLCAIGPDERCAAGGTLTQRGLDAGEYALIVKTTSGQPFDLSIRLTPPTEPSPNDICNLLTPTIEPGAFSTRGTFEEFDDNHNLSCAPRGARDAVYAFEVPAGSERNLRVTARGSGALWGNSVAVALSTDCNSRTAEILCRTGIDTVNFEQRRLRPGRYYLVVEPGNTETTEFSLNVFLADAPPRPIGDSCAAPFDLTPSGSPPIAHGSIEVNRLENTPDAAPSCADSTMGKDAVFTFSLSEPRDVLITAQGPEPLRAALMSTCGNRASEIGGCVLAPMGRYGRLFRNLVPGTYFFVTHTQAGSGTISVQLEANPPTPPPNNDRCPGLAITLPSSRTDTLFGFMDNSLLSGCGGGAGAPDAFYSFTLTQRRRVVATAQHLGGGAIHLALQTTCGSATVRACGTRSGTTSTITETLDPGTYYLVVESAAGSEGDFRLDVVDLPP